MTTAKQNILTPTGRIVWGNLYEPQTQDAEGRPLVYKTGAQQGQPRKLWSFGLAIPKTKPNWWEEVYGALILTVGNTCFPGGQAQSPAFSWKVTDGDSQIPNTKGVKPATREGYPGHWVLAFSSSFPPRIYNADGTAPIQEKDAVKPGYYVQVAGSVDGNESSQKPGVYLNHGMVALQGFGAEIHTGPDASSVGFGKGPAPAGMSAQPVGAMQAPPASVPGAGPAPAIPGGVPFTPPATPAPAPAAAPTAVVPNAAFLAPGAAPAVPAAPVAAPAAPAATGPVMLPKAAGVTYEAFKAKGWSDDQLRANGYIQ